MLHLRKYTLKVKIDFRNKKKTNKKIYTIHWLAFGYEPKKIKRNLMKIL